MKCSLGISDFLKRSLLFPILLFSSISLHCSLKKAFLSLLAILWNSAFSWVCAVLSCFSCVQLFVMPWTIIGQAPLSMGFSRQDYWSGLPFPSTGDFSRLKDEPTSPEAPALAADSLSLALPGKTVHKVRLALKMRNLT